MLGQANNLRCCIYDIPHAMCRLFRNPTQQETVTGIGSSVHQKDIRNAKCSNLAFHTAYFLEGLSTFDRYSSLDANTRLLRSPSRSARRRYADDLMARCCSQDHGPARCEPRHGGEDIPPSSKVLGKSIEAETRCTRHRESIDEKGELLDCNVQQGYSRFDLAVSFLARSTTFLPDIVVESRLVYHGADLQRLWTSQTADTEGLTQKAIKRGSARSFPVRWIHERHFRTSYRHLSHDCLLLEILQRKFLSDMLAIPC